jgi:hypothetical protein
MCACGHCPPPTPDQIETHRDEAMLDAHDMLAWPIACETGKTLAANPKGFVLVKETHVV